MNLPPGCAPACRAPHARRRAWLLLAIAVVVAASARRTHAQSWTSTAPSIGVSAVVLAPLTSSTLNNLKFGAVIPGDSAVVAASSGGIPNTAAAIFDVQSAPANRFLYVAFVLPSVLTNAINGATIPVSWSGTRFGAVCEMQGTTSCVNVQSFDPSLYQYPTPLQYPLTLKGAKNRDARIYLGGKLTPSVNQAMGDYIATVTLRYYSTN